MYSEALAKKMIHSDILDVEDFTFINEIINTLGLLYREAESYQNYIKTGDEKQATLYDNCRNNAWVQIVDLLGIEE